MTSEPLRIKIERLSPDVSLPVRASEGASGFDVMASGECVIDPGKVALVPTGLKMAIPRGFEIQVRPRSGLAAKNGVTVLNTPGTIDSDYRGEVRVILANFGSEPFSVTRGMRIAQLVVARVEHAEFECSDTLGETVRGSGGFGSTGV